MMPGGPAQSSPESSSAPDWRVVVAQEALLAVVVIALLVAGRVDLLPALFGGTVSVAALGVRSWLKLL